MAAMGSRASSDAKYQHQPLEHRDSIRLLILEPSPTPNAELHCHLVHERLSATPAYAAISYTWGAPLFPKVLYLPEGSLRITDNLHAALTAFRDKRQRRALWVDGVCIDQSDPHDKSRQVALMSEIYRKAQKVLGWLGGATPESRSAIRCLRQLAAPEELENTEESFKIHLVPQTSNSPAEVLRVSKALESCRLDLIYGRPWFSRLWIVQEVLLARSLVLHCGADELHWSTFRRAMDSLARVQNTVFCTIPDEASFGRAINLTSC